MELEAMNIPFQCDNGNKKILNSVSIDPENGEHVGLITPSGFRKTAFCKILVGREKPDRRAVALDGKNISSYAGHNPIQMMWQHPELLVSPRLRMREALREEDFMEERVVRSLGIGPDQLNRYSGELSGGELQRFCIAKALEKRAQFILTDEISTMLDLITQNRIWGFLLKEVETRDPGLLVVSHSKGLLERVCGRVIDLRTD